MGVARRAAELAGADGWLVRHVRPVRERVLDLAYGRSGLPRTVNGVAVQVLPRHRWYFATEYDAPVAAYLRPRFRPGAVCLSVGANLGVYPLQFAAWSAPDGAVYAFEPNPATAADLREHIRMNHLIRRIEVVEQAVADRPGTADFHMAGTDGMSRLGTANPELVAGTQVVPVPIITLDQFCSERGVRPDVLMIDVEGFEAAVLAGASEVFRNRPPVTVVEFHPTAWAAVGTNRATLEELLTEFRLRIVPLSGQVDPFAEYGHVALEPINP